MIKKPVIVKHDMTLKKVVEIMTEKDVNSVLVVDSDWKLVGSVDIVTLLNAVVPEYVGNRDMWVANFTTEELFQEFIEENKKKKVDSFMMDTHKVLKESSTALKACITVTEWRQTRVPVVDEDNKPVWIITRKGVRKYLAKHMGL